MKDGDPVPIAIVSIILYTALAVTSAFYFVKFRTIKLNKRKNLISDSGRYDEPKTSFFLILAISATLDIPAYIGCLVVGSPRDCEWDGVSYRAFWGFHLLALCGYAFAIVTPPVLWSDIINQKDGKLYFSKYAVDNTKRFFQIALLLYFATMTMNIVEVILHFETSSSYREDNAYYAVAICAEAVIIISICIGCLICGLRLQWYVKTVKLHSDVEMRFLFRLNVTLMVVLATYITRSIYIIHLLPARPDEFDKPLNVSYFSFTLCTRWLPFVVSPFCLVHEMRYSGAETAARNTLDGKSVSSIENGLHQGQHEHTPSMSGDSDRASFMSNSMSCGQLARGLTSIPILKGSEDDQPSSLSVGLLSDELSPSSRYFEDSFRIHSTDSLDHIDHFVGPPSFNETQSALHRTFSTPAT